MAMEMIMMKMVKYDKLQEKISNCIVLILFLLIYSCHSAVPKESNVMTIEKNHSPREELDDDDDDEQQPGDVLRAQGAQNDAKQPINLIVGDGIGGEHAEIISGNDPFIQDESSNFFSYFIFVLFASACLYVAYHNKSKMMALILEGRRSRAHSARGGRRKHKAAYRKLDCNLEEAISSSGKVSSSQVIY